MATQVDEPDRRKQSAWASQWSQWLFTELDSRNMRPADLARASGIPATRIANWRSGTIRPGLESCKQVAAAFGMEPEAVLAQAGYFIAQNAAERDAWETCFGQPISREGREFLRTVYAAWVKSRRRALDHV